MSDLDPQAEYAAVEEFSASISSGGFDCDGVAAAISAYRQAECKPFKDAPRDGTKIEAWHKRKEEWISIHYNHGRWTLTGRSLDWDTEDGLKAFTYFRIPFNPEEG